MPDRNASAAILTELANAKIRMFHLFEGVFPDGTVRYTDAPWTLVVESSQYLSLGAMVGFDAIEETADTQAAGVSITFAALNTILALLLQQNLVDRQTTIKRGFFDANNQVINSPIIIFKGRTDRFTLDEDVDKGVITCKLECSNQFVDFEKVRGRRTNDTEQQALFPGDKGFEFVADEMGKALVWR